MTKQINTVFIDTLFIILLVLILLPHQVKTEDTNKELGQLVIMAKWSDNNGSDVDLWVKTPLDSAAIGYSRLRGNTISLLRDELGHSTWPSRQEFAIGYDVPDGEYIVNLHLYRASSELPITVNVMVFVKPSKSSRSAKLMWSGHGNLHKTGQEITVIRFTLQDMVLVPGTLHKIPETIRSSR
jgi:hypothetical protein